MNGLRVNKTFFNNVCKLLKGKKHGIIKDKNGYISRDNLDNALDRRMRENLPGLPYFLKSFLINFRRQGNQKTPVTQRLKKGALHERRRIPVVHECLKKHPHRDHLNTVLRQDLVNSAYKRDGTGGIPVNAKGMG